MSPQPQIVWKWYNKGILIEKKGYFHDLNRRPVLLGGHPLKYQPCQTGPHSLRKIAGDFCIFFVWDFPTLCQHRRQLFIYLYMRMKCWSRGLYQQERGCWERVFLCGGHYRSRVLLVNLHGKEKSSSLLTFFYRIHFSECCRLYCKE